MTDRPLDEMSAEEKAQMRQRVEAVFGPGAVQRLAEFVAVLVDGDDTDRDQPPR